MPYFVTPNVIAIVILAVLAVSGFVALLRRFGGTHRRKFVILELDTKAKDINSVLGSVSLPLTFEVAVNQLGKDPRCYVAVPAKHGRKVAGVLGASEIEDYDIYYPGGVHLGAYLKGKGSLADFNIGKIDFSDINEIGEGAVLQFVFHKKRGGNLEANVRVLVSAPSSYQAKGILSRIKSSLAGFNLVEVKNEEFMKRVNSREFEPKEVVTLRV